MQIFTSRRCERASQVATASHLPAQVDKTPTPDPDIRRWPFWIKPAPRVIRTEAPKDSIPPFVKSEPRFISREEVALHNSSSSAFIILDNKVYDVTAFAPNHPGTGKLLLLRAGTDASESFFAFHPPRVRDNYLQVTAHSLTHPSLAPSTALAHTAFRLAAPVHWLVRASGIESHRQSHSCT